MRNKMIKFKQLIIEVVVKKLIKHLIIKKLITEGITQLITGLIKQPLSNNIGFSLLEVLMAVSLVSIGALVTGGFMALILGGFNFSKVTMDEQQLYASLSKTIGEENSCKGNLKPKAGSLPTTGSKEGVYGTNHANGVGDVKELYIFSGANLTGTPVIKIGDFGRNLEIVKMSLEDTDTTLQKPTNTNNQLPTNPEDRVFKVYYKHKQGSFKTKSNTTCDSTTQTGCYSMVCDMAPYETDNQVTPDVVKCIATCQLIHRPSSGGGGGGTARCYKVEGDATNPGVTAVGCGTTQANTNTTTTALGYNAGNSGARGHNTFIGYNAGKVSSGQLSTMIGSRAGENNTSGSNTFIGDRAGKNSTGGENIFIGASAGAGLERGGSNVFIGQKAGNATGANSNADSNVFIGRKTGFNIKTGGENIFIGKVAGQGVTTGSQNIFIGVETGQGDTTTTPDTPVTGGSNIAIGYQAGNKITSAEGSILIGRMAGAKLTTEQNNVFIGKEAGSKTKKTTGKEGDSNTFIGHGSGLNNTKGKRNVFIGEGSGTANTTADGNTFIGRSAGRGNMTGANNVFIGLSTGGGNTTAGDNTFIGSLAGLSNTTGEDNVFIGKEAGEDNTTGDDNIFIGNEAGEHNKGGINKTGSRQLNIGNLIFGRMPDMKKCKENLTDTDPSDCTGGGTPDEKNDATSFINSTDATKYLNSTDLGIAINGDLYVKGKIYKKCNESTGCKEAVTSSKVYKKNITPFLDFNKALTDITTTPLFTYEYKDDHPNHKRMGIIAEDLPPHLQIKDQYEPVKPDWVSIYGTFWASIKALFNKVTNLTKSILRLNSITSSLKVNLYEVKEKMEDLHDVKDRLEVLEKETQFLRKQNKELKKDNKELKRQIKTLNKKMKVSQ